MIQSTRGMSRPRAATSVQRRMPDVALMNSKKVSVRFCCFCLPCYRRDSVCELRSQENAYVEIQHGHVDIIQKLCVVFDRIATGEEDDHFLL